jgi:D-alanyl-D-alanine carboxypeptidase (penicillin-binding protein 5/6)
MYAAPSIQASAAVLIDAKTGIILYSKNHDTLRPPASTTKILTTILAIECGNLDEVVVISENAAATGEASLHLRLGEHITLKNLVYGALLKSGNDACVAIAEAIAPSEEEFIGMMNLKAQTLGAYNTRFFNTNGLPQSGHTTTAYDLALMTRYALENELFSNIVNTKEYTMKWEDSSRSMYLKNINKLLWIYANATGVKTGTTDKAGKCLVASARKEQKEIIAVLLNSPDRFGEARRLLEYGFNNI